MIAEHNFTRRRRDIAADIKGALIGQSHHEIAIIGLNISHKIFQPPHEALPIGLNRPGQGLRVCPEKIAWAEHIHDLAAKEIQLLPLTGVKIVHLRNGRFHRLGIEQILLLNKIKIRVLIPQRIRESAICWRALTVDEML